MTEQFKLFANRVLDRLVDDGFREQPIESTLNDVFFAALKIEGGMTYAAAIYNAAYEGYEQTLHNYTEFLREFATDNNIRTMIVFHIIATGQTDSAVTDFIDDASEEYLSQQIYEALYAVPLSGGEVYANPCQPDFLNMTDVIKSSLNCEGLEEDKQRLSVEPVCDSEISALILIVINAFVFALIEINGGSSNANTLLQFGALSRQHITSDGEYFRLFTYMFLHIGLMHLVYNSISLYIFGTRVEKYYGRLRFLALYLASGLFGALATLVFDSAKIAAGASGAIFGLMGATLAMTQVFKRPVGGLSFYTMIMFTVVSVGYGFVLPNIGNAAHLAGLICGYALGWLMCVLRKRDI